MDRKSVEYQLRLNAMLYGERLGAQLHVYARDELGIVDDTEVYREWLTRVVQRASDYAWYEPE